jgi:hypothetical protein
MSEISYNAKFTGVSVFSPLRLQSVAFKKEKDLFDAIFV